MPTPIPSPPDLRATLGPLFHTLKTWPEHFRAVLSGAKSYEVQRNDRGYRVGDYLVLLEWDRDKEDYTGRQAMRRITHLLEGPAFGIEAGYCVMGLSREMV